MREREGGHDSFHLYFYKLLVKCREDFADKQLSEDRYARRSHTHWLAIPWPAFIMPAC